MNKITGGQKLSLDTKLLPKVPSLAADKRVGSPDDDVVYIQGSPTIDTKMWLGEDVVYLINTPRGQNLCKLGKVHRHVNVFITV
ncbi:hypothetical protein HDV00_009033 [Rhizophlyctis rosea]|nr:hypothetical protein HDV00_009033 [Rhizophlyctis rosea]